MVGSERVLDTLRRVAGRPEEREPQGQGTEGHGTACPRGGTKRSEKSHLRSFVKNRLEVHLQLTLAPDGTLIVWRHPSR